ncbi:MAG TPA: c-type cytochrome, partial [Pirellulales bacterium]|nr:c-type cytochrome [Pirellulales bacterium]
LGVADTAPFGWNGGMPDLETQIRTSISSTMRGQAPTDDQVADLAAYLRTLSLVSGGVRAPGAGGDGVDLAALQELVDRGQEVFARQNCVRCHAPPTYTSKGAYDVGLSDEAGHVEFNPPSLRGVGRRERLFHDHRAGDLGEVFTRWRHQLQTELDDDELRWLIAFLRTL